MQTPTTTQAVAPSSEELGKLILRVALASLLLFHGVAKLIGGVGFITAMLAKFGLPSGIAYLVYVGEVVAPLLILFGVWTKPAAWIVAINMAVAVVLVHTGEFFTMTQTGGWALELQAMYFFAAVAVALLGAGRHSIGGLSGKWN